MILQSLPRPRFGRRNSRKAARQLQPDESRGRLAVAGISFVVGNKQNLPGVGGALGDDEGQGSFRKLYKVAPVGVGGEDQLAGYFGRTLFRAPHRLSLVRAPTGFRQIERRQWRRGSAGGQAAQPEQKNQEEHLFDGVIIFEHLALKLSEWSMACEQCRKERGE